MPCKAGTVPARHEGKNEMTIKFYAACLASYSNGILHGAWIDAVSDDEVMGEQVDAMLRKSPCPNVTVTCPDTGETVPSADEWLVHDYDDAFGVISDMGETSDLAGIAERMESFEEIENDFDETVLPVLIAWLHEYSAPGEWQSDLSDSFAGIWADAEDYASDLAESCGDIESVPEHLRNYIDFRAMARDMALSGEMDFVCISTGQHVQDYDSMRGREIVAFYNR